MNHFRNFLFVLFFTSCLCFNALAQSSTHSFLALGDSYTIGESVDQNQRWPVQLADALQDKGIAMEKPRIIARTGWTTEDLKKAIASEDLSPPYDLVSLLIGVNDQYQGFDIKDYPGNFRYLLKKAISLAGGNPQKVLVLSIPDYSVTPFARKKNPSRIARELKKYNAINKAISDSLNVHYVDITPISKGAAQDSTLLAPDQLHPSGIMYQHWINKALPEVTDILRN